MNTEHTQSFHQLLSQQLKCQGQQFGTRPEFTQVIHVNSYPNIQLITPSDQKQTVMTFIGASGGFYSLYYLLVFFVMYTLN